MNIDICRKHLVGKSVAFIAQEDYTKVYKGVITEVAEDHKFMGNRGLLILKAESADFQWVRAFYLVDGIIYCYMPKTAKHDAGEPMCSVPVIDGAIPLDIMMVKVIIPEVEALNRPPEPPKVWKLIAETGTFTGCKELTDQFVKDGLIRKEGKVLHVDFNISSQPGCMCGFTDKVEKLEFVTRDLKKFFEADEVVYHLPTKHSSRVTMPEIEPGYTGPIEEVPGHYEHDEQCGTYPVIKGLGMSWVCEGKE
jgi:hypothetical protein